MEKKYIVIKGSFGSEEIIIFSSVLDHKTVASDHHVISAGFVSFDIQTKHNPDNPYDPVERKIIGHCYGKSTTLGIGSRPKEDSILANILLQEDY